MSSFGVRTNIEPGVRNIFGFLVESQIQVWGEFGGGGRRSGGRQNYLETYRPHWSIGLRILKYKDTYGFKCLGEKWSI